MAEVFPPIHLYAVLAASIGLLGIAKDGAWLRADFPRNLWPCVPALGAGAHLAGYIFIDILNPQSPDLAAGEAWTLKIHAVVLSLFLFFALGEFFKTARDARAVRENVAEERLHKRRDP